MMLRKRLLGFAFASADLLIELDPQGRAIMALGSGPLSTLGTDALGTGDFDRFLDKDSALALHDVLRRLTPGVRSEPIGILMDLGSGCMRRATLSAFLLPDLAPNISCTLRYEGPVFQSRAAEAPPVLEPEAFLDRARALGGEAETKLDVSFIDITGLSASDGTDRRATRRVESALQAASVQGNSASRLTTDRYAVLRNQTDPHDLAGEVRALLRDEGLDLAVRSTEASLADGPPLSALRALRFAVQGCLAGEGSNDPAEAFDIALARTVRNADAFRSVVRDRAFALHYQPIVDLKTRAVHHFEALARFGGSDASPAATIHMAEELALIENFDLAVAEKALNRLRQPGSGLLKIAVNVSGASLAGDTYVQALLRLTATNPEDRRRLIVEVTESSALADIEAANRRLGALREAGIKLCIDDFGAGSASFDYVRGLAVDTVKIDGKLIQGVDNDVRTRRLLTHLVQMCGSMKMATIAEMIETEAAATSLRDLGINHGQGWLFGKAEAEPRTVIPSPVAPARRRGAIEAWG